MLDEAGFTDTKVVASSDLDEYTIMNLKAQGAKIDVWGVGTKLITGDDFCICKSGFIQHGSRFLGQIGEVSAVQADSRKFNLITEFLRHFDCIWNAGTHRIICIDQKDTFFMGFTIMNLKAQGAKIDVWGVGTKLITAYDQPALGAVYKLVSIEEDGKMADTIKILIVSAIFPSSSMETSL